MTVSVGPFSAIPNRPHHTLYKRIFLFALPLIVCAHLLATQQVLVLYDGEPEQSEAFRSASNLFQVFDHFPHSSKILMPLAEYSVGEAGGYDCLFVLLEEGDTVLPSQLLQDLARCSGKIVWIHLHIQTLLQAAPDKWPLKFEGLRRSQGWTVHYKGETFPKKDPLINVIGISFFTGSTH